MMLIMVAGTTIALSSCGDDKEKFDKDENPEQNESGKDNGSENDSIPGNDDEKVYDRVEQASILMINEQMYPITSVSISEEEKVSQIKLRTDTKANVEIKFKSSTIPLGACVESYNIELEDASGSKVVQGGPYILRIAKDEEGNIIVDLPKAFGNYNGSDDVFFSFYYKGKEQ